MAIYALSRAADADANLRRLIELSFYMDDFYYSGNSVEEVFKTAQAVESILKTGGFDLSKWMANHTELVKKWPVDERAKELKPLGSDLTGELPQVKALGVAWNCQTDTFTFESRNLKKQVSDVASVLSILASIYDPLGIVAPFVLSGKQIFQEIWKKGKGWKNPVPESYVKLWNDWLDQLPIVAELEIPRWYGFPSRAEKALHVFSDASTQGYGAVSYLVAKDCKPAFVAAKTRVVPEKRRGNIPRLELQAVLVAIRLAKTILEELPDDNITRLFVWTDSSTVWWWLTNEDVRYDTFIGNRVTEIHDVVESFKIPTEWRFVPTKENPADLASRGADHGATVFKEQFEFWIHGPEFLLKDKSAWPATLTPKKKDSALLQQQLVEYALPARITWAEEDFEGDHLVNFLIKKSGEEDPSFERLQEIETDLIKTVQKEFYPRDIAACMRTVNKTTIRREGEFRKRQIWVDPEGVLRLQTRIYAAGDWPVEAAVPIILPKRHPLAQLIIRDAHRQVEHQGYEYTWAKLREKYYITQGKVAVRTVCLHCTYCRRRNPRPVKPPMAGLHPSRLRVNEPAWTETGMDHFGPFLVTKQQKRWGLIFICLTTRAVHLEDVDGLGSEPFCHALDRFISRRRRPEVLRSDQGTAFVSLAQLQEKTCAAYARELSREAMKKFRVDLRFNPAEAPHWGGSWERMIREVKKILQSTLESWSGKWRRDEFRTFLVRAEAILNRRPIAFGAEGEIISPNNFLQPGENVPIGPPLGAPKIGSLEMIKKAEQLFWQKWVKFYLPHISAQRVLGDVKVDDLLPGDRVLLREGSNPLVDTWVPATIKEAFHSIDGVIRSVLVETENGELVRDISRISILDGPVLQRRKDLPSLSGGVSAPGRILRSRGAANPMN